MPTNLGAQNLRVSTGLLNTVQDDFPGGGSVTPGLAPAQPAMRVRLGAAEVKYDATVGTLFEGVYQYVQTYSGDANFYSLGKLVFWRDRSQAQVTIVDTNTAEVAGVIINTTITPGKWAFIQSVGEGGRATINIGASNPAFGDIAFVAGGGTSVANSATVAAITATQLARRLGKCESQKGVAGTVIVALDGCQD